MFLRAIQKDFIWRLISDEYDERCSHGMMDARTVVNDE